VTFPLRQGIAGNPGHTVYYVITDACDQTVAQSLGVNFTPKLANAGGTAAVQHSSSTDPTAIVLPGGVVINAPQIGDGANANGADKAHWADKVVRVDAASHTVRHDITNGCYEDQSVHYVSFDASAAALRRDRRCDLRASSRQRSVPRLWHQ
jgi:hypothetical protein